MTMQTIDRLRTASRFLHAYKTDINVICELLAVKHSDMELNLFSDSVLDVVIEFLCTK